MLIYFFFIYNYFVSYTESNETIFGLLVQLGWAGLREVVPSFINCSQCENNDLRILKFYVPTPTNYFLNIDFGFINLERSLWGITINFTYITHIDKNVFKRHSRGWNDFILVHLHMWHTIIYVENGQIVPCYLLGIRI